MESNKFMDWCLTTTDLFHLLGSISVFKISQLVYTALLLQCFSFPSTGLPKHNYFLSQYRSFLCKSQLFLIPDIPISYFSTILSYPSTSPTHKIFFIQDIDYSYPFSFFLSKTRLYFVPPDISLSYPGIEAAHPITTMSCSIKLFFLMPYSALYYPSKLSLIIPFLS